MIGPLCQTHFLNVGTTKRPKANEPTIRLMQDLSNQYLIEKREPAWYSILDDLWGLASNSDYFLSPPPSHNFDVHNSSSFGLCKTYDGLWYQNNDIIHMIPTKAVSPDL